MDLYGLLSSGAPDSFAGLQTLSGQVCGPAWAQRGETRYVATQPRASAQVAACRSVTALNRPVVFCDVAEAPVGLRPGEDASPVKTPVFAGGDRGQRWATCLGWCGGPAGGHGYQVPGRVLLLACQWPGVSPWAEAQPIDANDVGMRAGSLLLLRCMLHAQQRRPDRGCCGDGQVILGGRARARGRAQRRAVAAERGTNSCQAPSTDGLVRRPRPGREAGLAPTLTSVVDCGTAKAASDDDASGPGDGRGWGNGAFSHGLCVSSPGTGGMADMPLSVRRWGRQTNGRRPLPQCRHPW